MIELVANMNEILINHNLLLDEEGVLNEYEQVEEAWNKRANQLPNPLNQDKPLIKYLIIGEATVSYANYFYNPHSPETAFLRARHFNCITKPELINLFQANSVLVFDLYPLPLPTFIYDNVKFDCTDPDYVRLLNEYYEAKLGGRIDKNTKVVLRYIKLWKRCEWKIFVDFFSRHGATVTTVIENENERPLNISGNIGADENKIRNIFDAIIP